MRCCVLSTLKSQGGQDALRPARLIYVAYPAFGGML